VKKIAKFRYAVFGLAILACLGFWYFLIRVPYTRNEPKESDLAGVYRPDFKKHFSFLKSGDLPPIDSEIQVDADGKFELVNVLPWLIEGDTDTFETASVSTNGVWHLEKSDDGWVITSDFARKDGSVSTSFSLIGEKRPYRNRIVTWGTGEALYFVQSTN
jgi:hypothetical protein